MQIRNEIADDSAAIRKVTQAAFAPVEHSHQNEAAIIDALRRASALAVSLVAIVDDSIVGHVAFSPVTIDFADQGWFALGPVSVLPDKQKEGIGAALIRTGLDQLTSAGAKGCVVLGDPEYYRRFGFETDPTLQLPGLPPEYFMRLIIEGSAPSGDVEYHAGFDVS